MNFKEKVNRTWDIYAYDTGCVSSGIKDDEFKESLKDDVEELEVILTDMAKEMLSDDSPYDIEEVAKLIDWADDELDFNLS